MSEGQPIGYGLVGAGAFGRFCLEQYAALDGLRLAAVADVNADAARAVARDFGLIACDSVDDLLQHDEVDLVHIATPPTTHAPLVIQAVEAGKHVLCEKPLAVDLADADAMIQLARAKQRLLAVNLIMRYDPLCEAVKTILDEKLLGEPLHGFFENYAKDEPLGPDHWFWDKSKSGGIFIEHGVHFFDLFAWWLGEGEVVAAQQAGRPGNPGLIEQVHCTARYGDDRVLVNFYHGFTQAERMDRQEMRILCERGAIRLFEWVPTAIEIDALADHATLERLQAILPAAKVTQTASYTGDERKVYSRHKHYEVDGRYTLAGDVGMDKPALYGHVLRGLLADQLQAIADPAHPRRVSDANGFTSLRLAAAAEHEADPR